MRWVIAMSLSAATFLIGCQGGSEDHAQILRDAQPTLRHIDTISLEKQSHGTPMPVDRAATAAETRSVQQLAQTQPAAPHIALTIEEVRAAALANNLDLKVELVNPQLAQQTVDAERAKFDAVFNASANYTHNHTPGSLTDIQTYTAGIAQPLITGGTLGVSAPFSKSDATTPRFEGGLNVSLSQPLLKNAGIATNLYSIRVVEYQKGIIDAQTKLAVIQILTQADRAYWRLFADRGNLDVARSLYGFGQKQVDETRQRVAVGASAGIEITRAESGLASSLEGIIIAENDVRASTRDLKRIMNRRDLSMESDTELVLITPPNPLGLYLSGEQLAEHAVRNRMEMLQLELQLALDASTIDFQRNQLLPSLLLDYDYNLLQGGKHARNSLDVGKSDSNWSVNLTASIPIGNRAAEANLRHALLERVQRLANREQQQLAIRQEVFNALDNLNENWQRILAARSETVLTDRTYRAEQFEFSQNKRTSTDVLQAAAQLAAAQSREVTAKAEYELSRIDIAFATGTLIGQEQILLQSPVDGYAPNVSPSAASARLAQSTNTNR